MEQLRAERIEPPTGGRIDRMVRSALSCGEDLLFERVAARYPDRTRDAIFVLIGTGGDEAQRSGSPTS